MAARAASGSGCCRRATAGRRIRACDGRRSGDRARRESPRRVSRRAERRHPTSGYVARGKARRVPLTRATVRAVAVTLVLALCALYAIAAPARGQEHFVDEAINRV